MKYLVSLLFMLFFAANVSVAQIAVRVFNYRPTGEFGFVMKPQISAEILYQPDFAESYSGRWRLAASLLYVNLHPRLEVFPVIGVQYDGNTTVLPGAQSFQHYSIVQLNLGGDFAIVHRKKFNFFIGADLLLGTARIKYTNVIQREIDETYIGGGFLVGFRGRVGAEYSLNKRLGLLLSAQRNLFLITEPRANLSANDYGVGVSYFFY